MVSDATAQQAPTLIPLQPVHSRSQVTRSDSKNKGFTLPSHPITPGPQTNATVPIRSPDPKTPQSEFNFDVDERGLSSSGGMPTPDTGLSRAASMRGLLDGSDDYGAAGEILASDLPPTDRGKGAYSFLFAAMLTECAFFGTAFSFGTFLSFHQNDASSPFHLTSASAISATGSVLTGLAYAMPWFLRSLLLAKPHWTRPALLAALVLNVVSVLGASFLPANSALGLIFLQGLLPGIAGGTAFTPCMLFLPEWFDARRGMATGIVYLGATIGGTIFPLAFNALLQSVGFRWTLRVQAAIQLATSIVIYLFLRPRIPVRAPTKDERDRKGDWRVYLPGTPRALLNNPLGLCLCFVHMCQTSAWAAVSLFISTLCGDIGLSESVSNGVLAAFNASALVGLFGAGILADKIPFETIMIVSAGSCAIFAYLLLGFANSLGVVLSFVLLFGVTGSGFATAVTPASRFLSAAAGSPADFSLIALSLILARGVGVTVGPLIASALYRPDLAGDRALWGGHGLRDLVLFVGSSMLAVAGIAAGTVRMRSKQ
ncbi:hypothetical protein OC844_007024 [Tilletia horrida]|nr:hypothetical protein OC844_007024 [Tilletia horrida]